MNSLLDGAMTMAYLVCGLFFLRFWKRSRDHLFIYFAVAFWIFAIQRVGLAFLTDRYEDHITFYLLRLAGFLIILAGIWQKNRSDRA